VSKYRVEDVHDDPSWDCFVEDSREGTIFSTSLYLKNAVNNYLRLWVSKGNQIKAGLCLVLNADATSSVLDDLVIHNGLMFVNDVSMKEVKSRQERFEITEYVISYLMNNHASIAMVLAPQFEDIRPFLWTNYGSVLSNEKFLVELRYTSFVDISCLSNVTEDDEEKSILFKQMATIRQRNIREARKKGAGYCVDQDVEKFIEEYKHLMERQMDPQEEGKLKRMRQLICNLIDADKAVIIVSHNGEGCPVYRTIYCWDSKRAYYLFGAPSSIASERYKGTISFWDGFKWLAKNGINQVDMEGVNSPKRGWFKLSFGGAIVPYYQLSM